MRPGHGAVDLHVWTSPWSCHYHGGYPDEMKRPIPPMDLNFDAVRPLCLRGGDEGSELLATEKLKALADEKAVEES